MSDTVRIEDLLSDEAVEAAARVHADYEMVDWRGSVLEQARKMLEAAIAAATRQEGGDA